LVVLGSAHNPSTSKAPSLSPLATAHCAAQSWPIFEEVRGKGAAGWYEKLKNAGFDEDKLRRFAGLRTEKIDKFIEKTFPR
jgi:hypothetical protein